MERTADIDNALVQQKDRLLADLNNAATIGDFVEVYKCLRFVTPLWCTLGYGYKTEEFKARLLATLNIELDHAVRKERKTVLKTLIEEVSNL